MNRKHNNELLKSIRPLRLLNKVHDERNKGLIKITSYGCAVCGKRGYLKIHHLNYKENRTMPLCYACHYRVHHARGLEHLNPVGRRTKKDKSEIAFNIKTL